MTREELIRKATEVMADAPGSWPNLYARALADAGLLAEPDLRDVLQAQVDTQKQTLEIVRAADDAVVRQVDAALGHRYHRPGVHYSIPHVAEKAAAELEQLQAHVDAALALMDYWDAHGGSIPQGHRVRAALQGDQPERPGLRHILAWLARKVEQGEEYVESHDDVHEAGKLAAYQVAEGMVQLALQYPERWMRELFPRFADKMPNSQTPAAEPLHWRTEDGGIAAVMCSDCHTLGGHDDDCPRRTEATS